MAGGLQLINLMKIKITIQIPPVGKYNCCIRWKGCRQLVLGEISTGAYQDLKGKWDCQSMITKYGMSENLGNLVLEMKVMKCLLEGILHRQELQ